MAAVKIRVVTVVRNAQNYIEKCLKSLMDQRYPNWTCQVIDDASTDQTYEKACGSTRGPNETSVHKNVDRMGALRNICRAIEMQSPDPEDVIVTLDGDDWFAHARALERIAAVYQDPLVRLTYGMLRLLSNDTLYATAYPHKVVDQRTFRSSDWHASHPRTFKYELWKKIDPSHLLDPTTGRHWEMAWDMAMMFPMIEMCGPAEFRHIPEVLYVYNDVNPMNDNRVDPPLQRDCEARLRAMSPYEITPR